MAGSLSAKFKENALKSPGHTAIQYKKDGKWNKISYGELNNRIEFFAARLLKRGVKKGDRVAIILENGPEWPVLFFATISIGAIAVPINPEASAETIENILRDSGSGIVFRIDSMGLAGPAGLSPRDQARGVGRDSRDNASRDDTACILYTSGTTDRPKGVMLSHGNLLSNAESLHKLKILTGKDSVVSILPLHHAYSLTTTMILPLLSGAVIVYPGSVTGDAITEAMREVNPTLFMGVPRIFYAFHEKITEQLKKIPFPFNLLFNAASACLHGIRNKTGINLSRYLFFGIHRKFGKSFRLFISGGAKLGTGAAADLFRFGFTVLEGYGLTETSPVLTFNPLKNTKIGSAGVPVPGVEINIRGKNKEGIGEVAARGPNIMKGYYKRPDLTAEAIKGGWFRTGDLGYIDKDGYLFLTGRSKDVIVMSSGLNIYPDDIEEAYEKAPPVREICVFEVPRKAGREENQGLWAVVVPDIGYFRDNNEMNLKEVVKANIEMISRRLPAHKRIMGFTVTLDDLPRTVLGKVKRYAVREAYLSKITEKDNLAAKRELTEDEKKLMKKPVSEKIANYLKKETGVGCVSPRDTLELDLGIDSLKRIEIAAALGKIFRTKIDDEFIWRAFTVKDLIGAVEASLSGEAKDAPFPEGEKPPGPAGWSNILGASLKKENKEKIDLCPGLSARILSLFFDLTFGFTLKTFFNLKADGLENIPDNGPYIIFANHTSYFDPLIIAAALSMRQRLDLFFIGFKAFFDLPVIRGLIAAGRLIPLDFTAHFLEALRSCYYILENGKNLCIFPEGMRSFNTNVCEFKKGFGILARETGAKLLPVYIEGAFEAWPRTAVMPKRHPIRVIFGKPLNAAKLLKKGREMGAGDDYTAICAAGQKTLKAMRPGIHI